MTTDPLRPLPGARFDPRTEGLARYFGPQEAAIMETLLWEKAWLDREKLRYSYTYRVRETREAFEARMTAAIMGSLEG